MKSASLAIINSLTRLSYRVLEPTDNYSLHEDAKMPILVVVRPDMMCSAVSSGYSFIVPVK
jgi:hypothetical protein